MIEGRMRRASEYLRTQVKPECFDMSTFLSHDIYDVAQQHCGTRACAAGHVLALALREGWVDAALIRQHKDREDELAAAVLGLDRNQATALFYGAWNEDDGSFVSLPGMLGDAKPSEAADFIDKMLTQHLETSLAEVMKVIQP